MRFLISLVLWVIVASYVYGLEYGEIVVSAQKISPFTTLYPMGTTFWFSDPLVFPFSRNPFNIQTDLSVKASRFNESRVFIESLEIKDPQTEHHLLNIPLSIMDISSIGVKEVVSLNGVNVELEWPKGTRFYGSVNVGLWNTFSTVGNVTVAPFSISFLQAYSDGWRNNPFYLYQLSSMSQVEKNKIFVGIQQKGFSAKYFYGPSDSSETNSTYFFYSSLYLYENVSINTTGMYGIDVFVPSVNNTNIYNKHHKAFANIRLDTLIYKENPTIKANIGTELSIIDSVKSVSNVTKTLLGKWIDIFPYIEGDVSYSVGRFFSFVKLNLKYYEIPATIGDYNSGKFSYGTFLTYNATIGYRPIDNFSAGVSTERFIKIPSYTELYYSDPYNKVQGTSVLSPEDVYNLEIFGKYQDKNISVESGVYGKIVYNAIDFFLDPVENVFKATNIFNMKVMGGYAKLSVNLFNIAKLISGYAYNYMATEQIGNYTYRYLEIPKHKIYAGIFFDILDFYIYPNFLYTYLEKLPEQKYRDIALLNLEIQKRIYRNIYIGLYLHNLLDYQYYMVLEGNTMPGRSVYLSITANI